MFFVCWLSSLKKINWSFRQNLFGSSEEKKNTSQKKFSKIIDLGYLLKNARNVYTFFQSIPMKYANYILIFSWISLLTANYRRIKLFLFNKRLLCVRKCWPKVLSIFLFFLLFSLKPFKFGWRQYITHLNSSLNVNACTRLFQVKRKSIVE